MRAIASTLLLGSAAALCAAAARGAAEEDAVPGLAFRHYDHVFAGWTEPRAREANAESGRDCLGCHDYDDPPSVEGVCYACHRDDASGLPHLRLESRREGWTGLVDAGESELPFQHRDHLRSLECRDCHLREDQLGGPIPDPMPVPRATSSFCMECHDAERATRETLATGSGVRADFLSALNAALAARPIGERRFSHAEHGVRDALAAGETGVCMECHAGLADATARELGASQVRSESCGRCHVGAEGEAVAFELEEREVESRTALTFAHADHVGSLPAGGASGRAGRDAIEREGCLACHAHDSASDGFSFTEAFGRAEDKHDFCAGCHEGWRVEGHGDFDRCAECHAEVADLGDAMRTNRPTVEVAARPPTPFATASRRHPFVTVTHTEPVAAACSDCHRAIIETLPPRPRGRAFDHASHLGGEGDEARCRDCHAPVAESESLADVRSLHRLEACADCHLGVPRALPRALPSAADAAGPRAVRRFSHREHLDPASRDPMGALDCGDCHHDESAGTLSWSSFREGVLSCTLCHGHEEPEERVRSGGRAELGGAGCGACHREGFGAETGAGSIAVRRIASASAPQWHAPGAVCSECHVAPSGEPAWSPPRADHVFATVFRDANGRNRSPHQGNRYRTGEFDALDVGCLSCHWAGVDPSPPRPEGGYKAYDVEWRKLLVEGDLDAERNTPSAIRDRYAGEPSPRYPGLPPER